MPRTNRHWLPAYLNPASYLPKVQETRSLFARPPYLFPEFVGKALAFLQGDEVRSMGFHYNPATALPCKWRCSDESIFGVDLALLAYTGKFPFDKGRIGGMFNESSVAAAVHHGSVNIDFGGSHLGYDPGKGGGRFGRIFRPLTKEFSADCGYLTHIVEPFMKIYDDAVTNIIVSWPEEECERLIVSIPNEYIQPNWSSQPIKLLVDLDTLTTGDVAYSPTKPHTHTPIGRTLFYLNPLFLQGLTEEETRRFFCRDPYPIGRALKHAYFNIFDTRAELDAHGLPEQKLHLYMKFILSANHSPWQLKAAIINTNLEYNRLTDAQRDAAFTPYSFASFSGVFIDMYDEELAGYVNLFQPLGLSIKPPGRNREVEFTPDEIHEQFDGLVPIDPIRPLSGMQGYEATQKQAEKFTYRPGYFDMGIPQGWMLRY